MVTAKHDYNSDYFAWTQEQARLLKEGNLELVDLENLAEEIESLGKSDRRKLKSLFLRLLEHLLKRRYVRLSECYRGWDIEIRNFSRQIEDLLADSPSLKNYLREIAPSCYREALEVMAFDYEDYDFSGGLDIDEIVEGFIQKK